MNIWEKMWFKSESQRERERLEAESQKIGKELKGLEALKKNVEMGSEMQSGASGEARRMDAEQLERIQKQILNLEKQLREVGQRKNELELEVKK